MATREFSSVELLGAAVTEADYDEYLTELYSTGIYEESLGILERESELIDVGGNAIHQSESILRQSTTGAFVWRATPLFANWLQTGPLRPWLEGRTVVELGAGTGALACLLHKLVKKYIATDQKSVLKLMKRNCHAGNIEVMEFDWLQHEFLGTPDAGCVVACETVYNEFLIVPFVTAVRSVLRSSPGLSCALVCVQVRSYSVMEPAVQAFVAAFETVRALSVDRGVECFILACPRRDWRPN